MTRPTDAAICAYAAELIRAYAAGLDYLDLAEHMAYDDTIGDVRIADLDGPEIDDMQRRILDAAHAWGTDDHAAEPLRPEYGIRAEWISTRSSEGPVAETLDDALQALEQFDARHGDRVVSRALIERPVGDWRVLGDDGSPQQPANGADSHADAPTHQFESADNGEALRGPQEAATGIRDGETREDGDHG